MKNNYKVLTVKVNNKDLTLHELFKLLKEEK